MGKECDVSTLHTLERCDGVDCICSGVGARPPAPPPQIVLSVLGMTGVVDIASRVMVDARAVEKL